MRRLSILALVLIFLTNSARAGDEQPAENLIGAVKRATVFIQGQVGAKKWSGSGFVTAVNRDAVLIATNYHVVAGPAFDPKAHPTPAEILRNVKAGALTAVFDSGTANERSMKAEVLAADPDNDLAIIRVAGVKGVPTPVDYSSPPKLIETMPVYTFGFPFGNALATGKGSPAITIGKASISSIRLNDMGELILVQIDGALNPGNSGGPIVDAKGKLVGVAVATIKDSSGIGLAVPAAALGRMMDGRLGNAHVTVLKAADGKVTLKAEVGVIDPNMAIRSVTLLYLAAGPRDAKPGRNEKLEKLSGVLKLSLKLDGAIASGETTLDATAGDLFFQASAEHVSGSIMPTTVSVISLSGANPARDTVNRPAPSSKEVKPGDNVPKPGTGPAVANAKTTKIRGGGGNDPEFYDVEPGGGILVGFEIGLGKFVNNSVVKAICPLYRDGNREFIGSRHGVDFSSVVKVVAKPNYAVGAITVKTGLGVDGLSVTFMKIDGQRLDPQDAYESDWIGGKGGNGPVKLGGDGTQVFGLCGKCNRRDVNGLGLIFDRTAARGK